MGWVTKRGPRWGRFLLPERSRFSQIGRIIFRALAALKTSVPFTCRFVACSWKIKVDRQTHTQTDRPSTVTLAHAPRGLMTDYTIMKSTKVQTLGAYCISCSSPAYYVNARARKFATPRVVAVTRGAVSSRSNTG